MSLLAHLDLTFREEQFLTLARQLARAAHPFIEQAEREGELPTAVIQAIKASGYAALTVSQDVGGSGASLHEFALAQECLGRTDASLALIVAMNGHVLGSAAEGALWPEALYRKVAQATVSRGALINSLASEPELGSPSRGGLPRTRAQAVPDGWRLQGRKTWSTGAPALDFLVVTASVGEGDAARTERFLVAADAPGVKIVRTWGDGLALRGSSSHDVVFEDVFVPGEHHIPAGPVSPGSSAWFWTAVAATYLGVGEGALDALVHHAHQRVPTALGRPIATLPAIRSAVGQIELELAAAQALLFRATRAWSGAPSRRPDLLPALAAAKHAATNAAVRAGDLALRAAGVPAWQRRCRWSGFFVMPGRV